MYFYSLARYATESSYRSNKRHKFFLPHDVPSKKEKRKGEDTIMFLLKKRSFLYLFQAKKKIFLIERNETQILLQNSSTD